MRLNLIFEHIDQDLAQFLAKCPSPGLGPDKIKVKNEETIGYQIRAMTLKHDLNNCSITIERASRILK